MTFLSHCYHFRFEFINICLQFFSRALNRSIDINSLVFWQDLFCYPFLFSLRFFPNFCKFLFFLLFLIIIFIVVLLLYFVLFLLLFNPRGIRSWSTLLFFNRQKVFLGLLRLFLFIATILTLLNFINDCTLLLVKSCAPVNARSLNIQHLKSFSLLLRQTILNWTLTLPLLLLNNFLGNIIFFL